MNWFKKNLVLVPCDFAEPSIGAVDVALKIVDKATQVHVIHVLPVLAATEPGVVWDTVSDETRQEHVAKALVDQFAGEPYKGIHFSVAFGDPGQEITAYAQRVGADLIVMPSHGRTGLKHLLIGSVAERVCRLAHCPVLVLRE